MDTPEDLDDLSPEDHAIITADFLNMLHDAQLVTQQTINYMAKRAKKKEANQAMVIMSTYMVLHRNHQALMRGELGISPEVARQMFAAMQQHFVTQAVDPETGKPIPKH